MKELVIAFSQSDYVIISGGTEKCIKEQEKAFSKNYMQIFPIKHFNKKLVGINFNREFKGIYKLNDIPSIINNLQNKYKIIAINIHHIMGYNIVHLANILLNINLPLTIIMHDYYYICQSFKLIDSSGIFCEGGKTDCKQCCNCKYGKLRTAHLKKIRKFLNSLNDIIERIVVPSEYAKKIIENFYTEYKNIICVREHLEVIKIKSEYNKKKNKKIRIAYLGAQTKAKGFDVLYLPGCDHAGIATQAKIDEKLKLEGTNRYILGREKFLEVAYEWKDNFSSIIHEQWAKMGLMLDYSRERFTLDEGFNEAVFYVFKTLYDKGLIYRGEKIVNYDPVMKTALSNIEVIYKEDKGQFFYFKYRFKDDSNKYLTIATTRPETMFGDTCIVVNPNDERYKDVVGKIVINPANNEEIPVIADEYVDMEFGTGAMKCTPAHDPNDFIIGQKYNLPHPIIMKNDGTMADNTGIYKGLDRFKCRELLVENIKKDDNLIKIEDIVHQVGHSERSNAVVEPLLSKQWFIKMKPIAENLLDHQKGPDKVNFIPKRFEKILNAIQNKDMATLKLLFSKKALTEVEDFDAMANDLFDFFQGDFVSYDDWDGAVAGEGLREEGKEWYTIQPTYDVKTSEQEYRFAFKEFTTNEFEPDKVGIWSLYVIKKEDDTDPEVAYRGDGEWTPGIIIERKD